MMDALNLPVEMISVCSREGDLRPIRFRLTPEEGDPVTVRLRGIDLVQAVRYVGQEAVRYLCRGELEGRERRFELRYDLRSHRWVLHRFLD